MIREGGCQDLETLPFCLASLLWPVHGYWILLNRNMEKRSNSGWKEKMSVHSSLQLSYVVYRCTFLSESKTKNGEIYYFIPVQLHFLLLLHVLTT